MNEGLNSAQELSAHKLFVVLQKEYLICVLRAKIYPIKKHSEYWIRLSLQKKDKINHLKGRFKLTSMFDDEKIYKQYEKEAYNEMGIPNFYYPNENVKDKQRYWDLKNYFALGRKVVFEDEDDYQDGIIQESDIETKMLVILYKKGKTNLSFEKVKVIV